MGGDGIDLVNATSPGIRKCSPIDIGEGVPKNQPVGGCVVAKNKCKAITEEVALSAMCINGGQNLINNQPRCSYK